MARRPVPAHFRLSIARSMPMPIVLRALALPFALLLASAGAWGQPAASAPEGPTASITDTASADGRDRGIFFVLAEVNGKPVPNAIVNSQRLSRGMGPNLRIVGEERAVPAGRVKLMLVARLAHAAPINEIFTSIRNDPVTGVLDVEDGRLKSVEAVLRIKRRVQAEP